MNCVDIIGSFIYDAQESKVKNNVVKLHHEIVSVSSSPNGFCVLMKNGEVQSWGGMTDQATAVFGIGRDLKTVQLVEGQYDIREPQTIPLPNVKKVLMHFNCIVFLVEGKVFLSGTLRIGSNEDIAIQYQQPTRIFVEHDDIVDIASTDIGVYALRENSSLLYFGMEAYESLKVITKVVWEPSVGIKFKKIVSGSLHLLLLSEDGKVYAMGRNDMDQLAIPDVDEISTPTLIPSIQDIKFIDLVCGNYFSCALTEDKKSIYLWGANSFGQLGADSCRSCLVPIQLKLGTWSLNPFAYIKRVTCGSNHTVLVTSDNQVYTWGSNVSKELSRNLLKEEGDFTHRPGLILQKKKIEDVWAGNTSTIIICNSDSIPEIEETEEETIDSDWEQHYQEENWEGVPFELVSKDLKIGDKIFHLDPILEPKNLEEEETLLFSSEACLYKLSYEKNEKTGERTPVWKSKGVGTAKLLQNPSGKVRFLMRRKVILNICANHYLQKSMELKSTINPNSLWWIALDFADGPKGNLSTFCLRFKTSEKTNEFKNCFDAHKDQALTKEEKNNILNRKSTTIQDIQPLHFPVLENKNMTGFSFSTKVSLNPVPSMPTLDSKISVPPPVPVETTAPKPNMTFDFSNLKFDFNTPSTSASTDFKFTPIPTTNTNTASSETQNQPATLPFKFDFIPPTNTTSNASPITFAFANPPVTTNEIDNQEGKYGGSGKPASMRVGGGMKKPKVKGQAQPITKVGKTNKKYAPSTIPNASEPVIPIDLTTLQQGSGSFFSNPSTSSEKEQVWSFAKKDSDEQTQKTDRKGITLEEVMDVVNQETSRRNQLESTKSWHSLNFKSFWLSLPTGKSFTNSNWQLSLLSSPIWKWTLLATLCAVGMLTQMWYTKKQLM